MKPIKFKCPHCAKPIVISESEDGYEMSVDGANPPEPEKKKRAGNALEEFLRGLED